MENFKLIVPQGHSLSGRNEQGNTTGSVAAIGGDVTVEISVVAGLYYIINYREGNVYIQINCKHYFIKNINDDAEVTLKGGE